MPTLYHNPRCSKSRQALAILDEAGINFHIVRYLDNPLSVGQLLELISRLEGDLATLVRTGEKEFKESGIEKSQLNDAETVSKLISRFPRLMERPLFDNGVKAIIGRPPELVLD